MLLGSLFVMNSMPSKQIIESHLNYNPITGCFLRVKNNKPAGTITNDGYLYIYFAGFRCLAHRLAYKIYHGKDPKFIDHINGDRADNRISNLRSVDRIENQRNQKMYSNNKSGVVGVYFDKSRSRWQALIRVKGKAIHLGYFLNKEDAARARKKAEKEYGFHKNHGRKTP